MPEANHASAKLGTVLVGRAKKGVVKRGIAANRIILWDAGYEEDVITRLQPWPKDQPPYSVLRGRLARSEVKIFRDCRNKIFRPKKCPKLAGRA